MIAEVQNAAVLLACDQRKTDREKGKRTIEKSLALLVLSLDYLTIKRRHHNIKFRAYSDLILRYYCKI